MEWDPFLERLGRWLRERDLVSPQMRWVVGVSGGPDSIVLLHALRALSEQQELGWKLHVAHLHHGLRGHEADEDARFVEQVARCLGLPCFQERVNIGEIVAARGGSTEEVARRHRYAFLERVALKTGCDHVAVAHHADDDAETILHRICRGTGIRGLAGMRPIRPLQPGSRVVLVRPLLDERRATIYAICREREFETRADSSNDGTQFTRGRIRNIILPMIREHLNPNVTEALLRLGEQARWLETYLRDAAARTFESLVVSDQPNRIVLNAPALMSKQRIIQAEVVRRAVSLLPGGEQDLSFTHVDAVLRLAGDQGSGKELHLPGGVLVQKVYDRLEFRRRTDQEQPPGEIPATFVNCPGVTRLPLLDAELIAEIRDVDADKIAELRAAAHPFEQWLDYERLRLPLLVRGRREGDRFQPLGVSGTKSLSDFFIDEKIDPPLRARTGVLCDQAGVVWVMPLRIDERVKLRPGSRRALRLVLKSTLPGAAVEP